MLTILEFLYFAFSNSFNCKDYSFVFFYPKYVLQGVSVGMMNMCWLTIHFCHMHFWCGLPPIKCNPISFSACSMQWLPSKWLKVSYENEARVLNVPSNYLTQFNMGYFMDIKYVGSSKNYPLPPCLSKISLCCSFDLKFGMNGSCCMKFLSVRKNIWKLSENCWHYHFFIWKLACFRKECFLSSKWNNFK